jgi:hypothetical protein
MSDNIFDNMKHKVAKLADTPAAKLQHHTCGAN